jgi:hypothetical protein
VPTGTSFARRERRAAGRAAFLTEPIGRRARSLRLLDACVPTLQAGTEEELAMLDALMLVLTVVAFGALFALIRGLERV